MLCTHPILYQIMSPAIDFVRASPGVEGPGSLLKEDEALSYPLTLSEIQAHGSFTILPVRVPYDLRPIEDARDEIRALWEEYMQDGLIKTNMCTECPIVGDYLGVAYPGTRPERIKAFTWLYTIFFLLDGVYKLMVRQMCMQLTGVDKVEYMSREEARKVHVRIKKIIQHEVRDFET